MLNTYIFVENQISDEPRSYIRVFPLQHPRKSLDYDSFLDFLEKLQSSFGTTFWYYVQLIEVIFPVHIKGLQITFH